MLKDSFIVLRKFIAGTWASGRVGRYISRQPIYCSLQIYSLTITHILQYGESVGSPIMHHAYITTQSLQAYVNHAELFGWRLD